MNEVDKIGDGIFELDQQIGQGGAATVWKATETEEPRRQVAVKLVIYPEEEYLQKQESIESLFAREARTWAEFQRSPYVVQLYRTFTQHIRASVGMQHALGFIMEFCAEGDLRRALKEKRLELDRQALIAFLLDIARGLKEGHDKDIVHRDIKSSNVLLFKTIPNKLCPKLMDFGLSITTTMIDGRLVGTPEYMAPEVFDDPQNASKASDIYSLGVLFYEVICGRLPFHFLAQTKEERLEKYKHAHQSVELDFDELRKKTDRGIAKLLENMLQKQHSKRLQLNRVIVHLEKLEISEIVETLKGTPESARQKENRYLWHPGIHASLGEVLSYFIIRGTSFKGDPTWLTNNLKERSFHGFSIYTIIGGYDYILRIWYPRDSQDDLDQVMRDFRDFHNGSFLRFNVSNVALLRGRSCPKAASDEGDLLNEIVQCFSSEDREEHRRLREKGFILGPLTSDDTRKKNLRLFLTVNVGARTEPFLVSAYANEFAKRLQVSGEASSVSVYEGEGDFQILIKFRLKKFEQFSSVYDSFLTTKALIQRNDSLIRASTFIEFGGIPVTESDDGMIITEVSKLVQAID